MSPGEHRPRLAGWVGPLAWCIVLKLYGSSAREPLDGGLEGVEFFGVCALFWYVDGVGRDDDSGAPFGRDGGGYEE